MLVKFKIIIALIMLQITPSLWAQYQLTGGTFSNGIILSGNSSYNFKATVGQPIIGQGENDEYTSQLGIWYSIDVITTIDDFLKMTPKQFRLFQNYPNPFNPLTTIKYAVPKQAIVNIDLYNLLGQKVQTLVKGKKAPGVYEVKLQAARLASGLYIYRMYSADFHAVRRLIILK